MINIYLSISIYHTYDPLSRRSSWINQAPGTFLHYEYTVHPTQYTVNTYDPLSRMSSWINPAPGTFPPYKYTVHSTHTWPPPRRSSWIIPAPCTFLPFKYTYTLYTVHCSHTEQSINKCEQLSSELKNPC